MIQSTQCFVPIQNTQSYPVGCLYQYCYNDAGDRLRESVCVYVCMCVCVCACLSLPFWVVSFEIYIIIQMYMDIVGPYIPCLAALAGSTNTAKIRSFGCLV